MKYKKLGNTGLDVSELCLGTMTWGHQNSEADGHAQMDYALDQGINFFDTAELRDGAPIDGPSVEMALNNSLKRLQTDRIELYQLHWPNRAFPHFGRNYAGMVDFTGDHTTQIEQNFLEVLETLQRQVQAGKIHYIGLSNETAWGTMKYLQLAAKYDLPRVQSLQNEFSLLNRSDDPFVAEVCVRENIAYLPWSPLGGGALSGKYIDGNRPAGSRWALDHRPNFRDTSGTQMAVRGYRKIAEEHNLDLCQMLLAFIGRQNFVTAPIIGATSMDQLKTNIGSAEIDLPEQVAAEIEKVYKTTPIPF